MMNSNEKKEHIHKLCENDLRQNVLIPLLSKLGFLDPIHNHHAGEKGKDIVCKVYDPTFKKTKYLAVIVKKGDITGSASSSNGYPTIINQIKQVFNEPYKHIYDLKEVDIDECILVTSGRFLPTSLDSIYRTLKAERLDKAIREAIDIDKLIALIDEYFSEYWSEHINEKESLINQRNYLLNNLSKLVKIIMPEHKDQEKTLKLMSQSEINFDLSPYNTTNRYIANIGHDKIEIDDIDEYFIDDIDNFYCDIKDYFFDIKKKAQSVLYDIDEAVEILKVILQEKNPSKIIEHCWDLKGLTNYQGNLTFNSKDLPYQDDFYSAIESYKDKKELLIEKKALSLYYKINQDIKTKCTEGLVQYWKKYPKDQKNQWIGYQLNFSLNEDQIISSKVYEFARELKKSEAEIDFNIWEGEVVKSNDLNSISVEIAVNKYGIANENTLSMESKAEQFIWHFRKPLLDKFIEILKK